MDKTHDLYPLLEIQQNKLKLLFADGDSIDTKSLAILAINVAILLFVEQSSLHFHSVFFHGLFLAPFIASLVLDGFAIWPRKYIGPGVDLDTHPEYLSLEATDLMLQLLSDTQLANTTNLRINTLRWRLCLSSILLTAIGTAVLFVII